MVFSTIDVVTIATGSCTRNAGKNHLIHKEGIPCIIHAIILRVGPLEGMRTWRHLIAVSIPCLKRTIAELQGIVNKKLANIPIGTFSITASNKTDATIFHKINRGFNGRSGASYTSITTHHTVTAVVAGDVRCRHHPWIISIKGVVVPSIRYFT